MRRNPGHRRSTGIWSSASQHRAASSSGWVGVELTRAASGAARPELAVAGVAEARHDVALLVELAVERRAVDLDVRMGRGHRRDALRRGDQVDQLDPDRLTAPQRLRTSIAAVAEPPVASIGSRIRHRSTDAESGSLL